ncbi:Protein-L-isoaspartate(D-aspartate) O-methyltransferase [Balamuthia mandrillaris]
MNASVWGCWQRPGGMAAVRRAVAGRRPNRLGVGLCRERLALFGGFTTRFSRSVDPSRRSFTTQQNDDDVRLHVPFDVKEEKGITFEHVIDTLVANALLQEPRIIEVVKGTDPRHFLDERANPWLNIDRKPVPDSILHNTLVSLYSYAIALQMLESRLQPGMLVLDVGCTHSGLLAACVAQLVGNESWRRRGHCFVTDSEERRLKAAKDSMMRHYPELSKAVSFHYEPDPTDGLNEQAPYDAIHIGYAVKTKALNRKWLSQLKDGGVMTLPIVKQDGSQTLHVLKKHNALDEPNTIDSEAPVHYPVLE